MKFVIVSLFLFLGQFAQAQANVAPFTAKDHNGVQILGDSQGRTLYTFDPDTTSASTCYNRCATEWPPALLSETTVQSVNPPLGTSVRKDQTVQITFNGKPVYRYIDDETTADALGDGLGGIWHVVVLK